MIKLQALIVLTAALSAFLFSQGAQAQYPPPTGSVTLTAGGGGVGGGGAVGGQVLLTSTVLSPSGTPIGGAPVTFYIISEPGTDAAVGSKVITVIADANGVATDILRVGSTPGTIVVGVSSGGLQSQVIVQVRGASVLSAPGFFPPAPLSAPQQLYPSSAPATLPAPAGAAGSTQGSGSSQTTAPSASGSSGGFVGALPPAAPLDGSTIRPPNTGDAGLLWASLTDR